MPSQLTTFLLGGIFVVVITIMGTLVSQTLLKQDQVVSFEAPMQEFIDTLSRELDYNAYALRSLAQSMARELGPQGIHVAHPIIDGAIDTAFIRDNFPERYALKDQDGILNPDHIADQYWAIHAQPRDSWTHELDLRPWMETF